MANTRSYPVVPAAAIAPVQHLQQRNYRSTDGIISVLTNPAANMLP